MKTAKTAIIIGATGATGECLVKQTLENPAFYYVKIFIRRPIELEHPKLIKYVVNFEKIDTWQHLLKGDILYLALGSTLKDVGRQGQYNIDFELQYNLSKHAISNGISAICLVSAVGANANSKLFYSKIKGKLEKELKLLPLKQLFIFQPGLLVRPKHKIRWVESISYYLLHFFNSIGIFKKFKPLPVEILAKKMIFESLHHQEDGIFVYKLHEIFIS
ncbi:MAG: NAD(P)H-binding protein [Alphaproteobacteria bacterium]|nr:NAD(P)H-binding protein [Alphaproteobacteria bacterium]